MKKIISILISTTLIISLLSGCNKPNSDIIGQPAKNILDDTETEVTESPIEELSPTPELTDDFTLTGTYDSIFDNEMITINEYFGTTIVIDGYEFTVDDNTYCSYFDNIGPLFTVGEQMQYKIKVLDKSYDEFLSSDITQKAVSSGGNITHDPEEASSKDLKYTYFEYILSGEKGIAVTLPGPDNNKAIGVQIALTDDTVNSQDAINSALNVASTAVITSKADTTKEEIDSLYRNTSFVTGVWVEKGSISFNDKTYNFTVPKGYRMNSDISDDESKIQTYSSKDTSLMLTFKENKSYTDARNHIECMMLWCDGDSISEVTPALDGTAAYATYYNSTLNIYGIEASMFTNDGYIVAIEAESDTRKIAFEDVAGFFDNTPSSDSKSQSVLGPSTAILHDQIYIGNVSDYNYAKDLIKQYGLMQKERYSNPEVSKIEQSLEEKYDIAAVNLGEIDLETAKDIEKGVSYMFDTYPIMKGSLNTITLANLKQDESRYVAVTKTQDFIVQDDMGSIPKVVRHEIVLNANKWLNRDGMIKMCKENVESGYWFKNVKDPSKIIVHELGHQLLNVLIAKEYSYYDVYNNKIIFMPCLLTKNNQDAYLDYYWSMTALNQTYETKLIKAAYKEWLSEGHTGTEEDFRKSISEYANGIKSDGGVSYQETFAEAVADVYCNGNSASDASKAILNQIQ